MINVRNILLADGTVYEKGSFDVPVSFLGEFIKLDLPNGETEYIAKDMLLAFTMDSKKPKLIQFKPK